MRGISDGHLQIRPLKGSGRWGPCRWRSFGYIPWIGFGSLKKGCVRERGLTHPVWYLKSVFFLMGAIYQYRGYKTGEDTDHHSLGISRGLVSQFYLVGAFFHRDALEGDVCPVDLLFLSVQVDPPAFLVGYGEHDIAVLGSVYGPLQTIVPGGGVYGDGCG